MRGWYAPAFDTCSLGVSRNTAALAYELLLLEGYIESRVGGSTKVAYLQPEQ